MVLLAAACSNIASQIPLTTPATLCVLALISSIACPAFLAKPTPTSTCVTACSISFTASRALAWISWIICPISTVADVVLSASFLTSSATTANPRPVSPARAASMAAFSANKFVWSATSLITWITFDMFSERVPSNVIVAEMLFTVPAILFISAIAPWMIIPPSSACLLDLLESESASRASSPTWLMLTVTCSVDAAMAAVASLVSAAAIATCWEFVARSAAALETLPISCSKLARVVRRDDKSVLNASAVCPISSLFSTLAWTVKSLCFWTCIVRSRILFSGAVIERTRNLDSKRHIKSVPMTIPIIT